MRKGGKEGVLPRAFVAYREKADNAASGLVRTVLLTWRVCLVLHVGLGRGMSTRCLGDNVRPQALLVVIKFCCISQGAVAAVAAAVVPYLWASIFLLHVAVDSTRFERTHTGFQRDSPSPNGLTRFKQT